MLPCFLALQLFVIMISVHDAALLVVNQELIVEFERNPIGSWLIELNAGSVWLFVCVKLIGTCLVSAILASMYEQYRPIALTVAGVLALFQGILLLYLYGA